MNNINIVILGAGPAGLTAAHEFTRMGIQPMVIEKAGMAGGIARTETRNGYHFDMGGHRFFSRNEQINQLWKEMLGDNLLKVPRMSRIYYRDRFYNYPLEIRNALLNLGMIESILIPLSYLKAQIKPHPVEETFDQWVSNRFGQRLYQTFFRTYTEKVWGMPCRSIRADWAAQRIKGLSLTAAVVNALTGIQKTKTLINEFDYPLKGPGMMWQRFQEVVESRGGHVLLDSEAVSIRHTDGSLTGLEYVRDGEMKEIKVGHLVSSIPLSSLVAMLEPKAPEKVLSAAAGLSYRAFIIVMLIVDKKDLFPDQWIYIHSPDVKTGRIQNFKNWSPAMVPDQDKTSVGMEYFCSEGDDIWSMTDNELSSLASLELSKLGLADKDAVMESFVVRQPGAYPVYDDNYKDNLDTIREYLGTIGNLQTIGRNGTHRYNNMDHSMLAGMLAVQNFHGADHDLWNINEENTYLEEDRNIPGRTLIFEKIIGQAFARMDQFAFAIAVGSVSGLLLFMATIWLVIKGGETVGPNLQLLSQYFTGYTVTVKGAFIALVYSFFWGFLFGWLFAYLRNLFLSLYLFWIRKKTELLTFKDFFDHL